jgi:hypothetical protein
MRKQKIVGLHIMKVEFGVFGKVKWEFLLVGCTLWIRLLNISLYIYKLNGE